MSRLLHPIVSIYARNNYDWKTKDEELSFKDDSLAARLDRLRFEYKLLGLRRSVQLVLMVHEHNMAHVLLFQRGPALFMLPWDDMDIEETELDTVHRILVKFLNISRKEASEEYEVTDLVSRWWRPNFEPNLYPYIPSHASAPKEMCTQFLVQLPEKATFSVCQNLNIVSLPLMELCGNSKSYGSIISSLPLVLNRFQMNLL